MPITDPSTIKNKVKFGLEGVYYAFHTDTGFSTPVPMEGAVNLSLDAEGDETSWYADDYKYYVQFKNDGYSGTLEMAIVPDEFLIGALGWVKDANGNLVEVADATTNKFALLFKVKGDKKDRYTVYYDCEVSRPSVAAQTTESSITPQTDTLNITITPRLFEDFDADHRVVKLTCETGGASYANFTNAVVTPKKSA